MKGQWSCVMGVGVWVGFFLTWWPLRLNSLHSGGGVEKRWNNEVTNSFINLTHTVHAQLPLSIHTETPQAVCYMHIPALAPMWWWAEPWQEDCLAQPTVIIMELKQLNLFLFAIGFHSNTTSPVTHCRFHGRGWLHRLQRDTHTHTCMLNTHNTGQIGSSGFSTHSLMEHSLLLQLCS